MEFMSAQSVEGNHWKQVIKRPSSIAALIVLLIILFFVLCFRTVGAGQVGVITRFGEIDRIASSGPVVKLPWPIEKLNKMDTRIQKQEENAAAATSDLQDVNATLALNYALDQEAALRVFKTIGTEYRDRVVVPAVQESFKAATAQYTASELLVKRAEVKGKALDAIRKRLQPYGVRVDDLNIVNFSFSPEFTKAIESKQVAAQEAEKAKYEIEKARNQAQANVESARGIKEANELMQQSISQEILQRWAIEKWNGVMPLYVGSGTVFNIPLTK